MEGKRFDRLTKVLRRTEPRRDLLVTLSGLVALAVGVTTDPAAARGRRLNFGARCLRCGAGENNPRCKNKCVDGAKCRDRRHKLVKKGGNGFCSCATFEATCNGACYGLDEFAVCPVDEFPRCNDNDNCLCTKTVEDEPYCAQATNCLVPCTSSASCPEGSACVVTCCDGPGQASPHCLPACG